MLETTIHIMDSRRIVHRVDGWRELNLHQRRIYLHLWGRRWQGVRPLLQQAAKNVTTRWGNTSQDLSVRPVLPNNEPQTFDRDIAVYTVISQTNTNQDDVLPNGIITPDHNHQQQTLILRQEWGGDPDQSSYRDLDNLSITAATRKNDESNSISYKINIIEQKEPSSNTSSSQSSNGPVESTGESLKLMDKSTT